ncbi:MAG: DUF72 domain-containing protein [Deltaproteobacteria bacterium]|nr:DUF72 domain-containing protein [Deltaproteobacteria bacterium]
MDFHVGTSGYNYPEWKGAFYPPDLPAAKMLAYYAARFSAVEINYTFYRMPNAKTVAGWAAATPERFTFVLKAPRRITHDARLKDVDDPLRYFCETARTLGPKLGPLLFQLPPSFRKDPGRLADVLDLLPPGLSCACEFRHASWFSDDVYDLLRARNTALCIADNEEGSTPAVTTADFGYLRLRAVDYSEGELRQWVETIRRVGAAWRQAFVFFKHEESATGPALAQRFRGLLTGQG